MSSLAVRILAAGVVMTGFEWLSERLAGTPVHLVWVLAANLLLALTLMYVTTRLQGAGWRLAGILFLLMFGLHCNNLVEAVFFQLDIPRAELATLFLSGFVRAAFFAPLLVWASRKWSGSPQPALHAWTERSALSWIWRIAACDLAYVFFYLLAGMIIFPYVHDFYASRQLPALLPLMVMQIFRGLVFVGLSLLVIRRAAGSRREVALVVGLVLSVVGGIVPLLAPNPYIPTYIRWVHGCEVGVSNLLFGCLVGWLLVGSQRSGDAALFQRPTGVVDAISEN